MNSNPLYLLSLLLSPLIAFFTVAMGVESGITLF